MEFPVTVTLCCPFLTVTHQADWTIYTVAPVGPQIPTLAALNTTCKGLKEAIKRGETDEAQTNIKYLNYAKTILIVSIKLLTPNSIILPQIKSTRRDCFSVFVIVLLLRFYLVLHLDPYKDTIVKCREICSKNTKNIQVNCFKIMH